MPNIFVYSRDCTICKETKPFAEMVRCKGVVLSRCLACARSKHKARPGERMSSWLDHPWKKEYTKKEAVQ